VAVREQETRESQDAMKIGESRVEVKGLALCNNNNNNNSNEQSSHYQLQSLLEKSISCNNCHLGS
jgi:hypothetical protein